MAIELELGQQAALTAHLRDLQWIDADETVQQLAVPGEGNMNRTLRATTERRSLILKQSVPFVAKYPDIAAPPQRIEVENAFYEALQQAPELRAHTPARLGFDRANRLLALSDLGDAGDLSVEYAASDQPRSAAQLEPLTRWLSALHQLEVKEPERFDNLPLRELNHAHIFAIPFAANNGLELSQALSTAAANIRANAPLMQRINHLGDIYMSRAAHTSRPVLLHGDYYPGSWLRDANKQFFAIDPEFAFVGPAEFDVGVMLAHLEFCGYPEHERKALLEGYQTPTGFDPVLAAQFSAVEQLRRLLGVAQLPLAADESQRLEWIAGAMTKLT